MNQATRKAQEVQMAVKVALNTPAVIYNAQYCGIRQCVHNRQSKESRRDQYLTVKVKGREGRWQFGYDLDLHTNNGCCSSVMIMRPCGNTAQTFPIPLAAFEAAVAEIIDRIGKDTEGHPAISDLQTCLAQQLLAK